MRMDFSRRKACPLTAYRDCIPKQSNIFNKIIWPYKSLGPNGINNAFLQRAAEKVIRLLMKIAWISLTLGHILQAQERARWSYFGKQAGQVRQQGTVAR